MPLYGMINVAVQFDLSKIEDNIDAFKSVYGVSTDEEVYARYMSDMSKTLVSTVEDVEGIQYEARLQGVARNDEENAREESKDLDDKEFLINAGLPDSDMDEEVSEEVDSIIANIDKVGIEHGLVTKVVVSELNPRLKNFTKLIGVPVETAEMSEDYYLMYEEYGTGEEKTWSPKGEENK